MSNFPSNLALEAVNLYIMYNELLAINYKSQDYKNVLKHFYKVWKYFNFLYDNAIQNPNTDKKQINNLKDGFYKNKIIAEEASKKIEVEISETNIDATFDEYETILLSDTNKAKSYEKLAIRLNKDGVKLSAITFLKKSLQINPKNYENYRILGDWHHKINDLSKAIAFYEKYNEFSPQNPLVYNSLGSLYAIVYKDDSLGRQIECFKKAIEISPDYKDAIRNLAIAYRHTGNSEQTIKYYERLIKLGATNDDLFSYACEKIKIGDFKQGWGLFEHRFDKEDSPVIYPELSKPKWNGKQNLEDKILLVQYEQGFGDSITFVRYLKQIKAKKIIFRVQDGLVNLLKDNINYAEIIGKSVPVENITFDYHVPLMSLPHILNFQKDNIPLSKGYIKADKGKIEKYKKEYFNNNCFKIGITWHGALKGNENRNIPLKHFCPLTKLDNVKVYSFQKDFEPELSKDLPADFEMTELGQTFNDFSDTAAAMANVDLFVTSDNGVCNLAAAMGKNTFLLIHKDAEWRWFTDEEKTPWYDSITLFKKQSPTESWDNTIQKVIESINK